MKKLLIVLLIPVISACSTDDPGVCCTNIDTSISMQYFNLQGVNLFETGVYTEANTEVYYKIDGEWVRNYNSNMDAPKGIWVSELEDGIYLTLSPSDVLDANNTSETKIEFSETDFDIIKAEVDRGSNHEIVTKVWYNDVLRWEAYETDRQFAIIKEQY